jgi:hypothetical protein
VLLGIVAWILEWWLNLHTLEWIVLGSKVVGFVSLVFCVRHLAPSLFRSWRCALALWAILSASSVAALFASVPFRLWMPRWANDGRRRWYYEGMPYPEGDYPEWLADWHSFGPHLFEAAVFMVFFALLLVPCVLFRTRLWSASLSCVLSFALLAIAPLFRGLLEFDYDTFHLGVALDSIALSLWPMGWSYSDAHTIFTLGFLAVIFIASRVFLALPLSRRNDSKT